MSLASFAARLKPRPFKAHLAEADEGVRRSIFLVRDPSRKKRAQDDNKKRDGKNARPFTRA